MYTYVYIFAITGIIFVLAPFCLSILLAPRQPNAAKLSTYECGETPFSTAWVQYNVRYYIFALIFVIFDVETIFLYPWAIIIRTLGLAGLVEMFIFLIILFLGLVYAWKKGALVWQ